MVDLRSRRSLWEAGTSKSTILRAIQSGRLSAPRTDDGGYAIDPAELFRVYRPLALAGVAGGDAERSTDHCEGQDTTVREADETVELRIRNARLEAEVMALKTILDSEKRRGDEIRDDRDRWHAQAERFALAPPATVHAPLPGTTHDGASEALDPVDQPADRSRGLFAWLKRA